MTGIEDGVVRHTGQPGHQRLVHGCRVTAREVGPSTSVEEQGVAGDELAVDQEALTAWRVTRRVHERDGDPANLDDVTTRVEHEVTDPHSGGPLHPWCLVGLDVDRHLSRFDQPGDALDLPPHHFAAHVVRMEVRGQRPDAAHVVGGQHAEQVIDAVGGVDDHRLACLSVPHQVDEVDHLLGNLVVGGEVPPG